MLLQGMKLGMGIVGLKIIFTLSALHWQSALRLVVFSLHLDKKLLLPVAGANGTNRPIWVPCQEVISSSGAYTVSYDKNIIHCRL